MSIDRTHFELAYAERPPWDIGRPQKDFIEVADQITGSILDVGCGTGENTLYFASRGQKVTGIDFVEETIRQARAKAAERGLTANFMVMDALALKDLPEVFDSLIDCGLFHGFSDEDRKRYVEGLASVIRPGGKLFLLCFSDQEPIGQGPRRVSRKELESAFSDNWTIESLKPTTIEVRSDVKDMNFSEGGPKAWFATMTRTDNK